MGGGRKLVIVLLVHWFVLRVSVFVLFSSSLYRGLAVVCAGPFHNLFDVIPNFIGNINP